MLRKAVLLFLILPFTLLAQTIEFRNYTVRDGLSNNKVNCLIQDRQGFLWFGSEDGLNRFDGYMFKVFRSSDKKNSITSKDIWSLFEDREGNIWIGTKSGDISKLNFETKKFSHWKIQEVRLNDNSVTAIYVDRKNFVWVGTYQQGLFKFDSTGKNLDHWEYNPESKTELSNNFITSIVEDRLVKYGLVPTSDLMNLIPYRQKKDLINIFHLINQSIIILFGKSDLLLIQIKSGFAELLV